MKRVRNRVLYGLTLVAWMGVAHFACMSIMQQENVTQRVWLMIAIMAAGVLTTATLFAVYVAPLERAYHAGFQAGQRASGCSAFRPVLTAVSDQQGIRPNRVVPIRASSTDR